MATIDQIERRPSFGNHVRFIREDLPLIASFKFAEERGAVQTADKLAEAIRAIVESIGSQSAAKLLLDLTDDIEEQKSNDHFHRPLYEMGPKRKGALVAVSRIPTRSDQNPKPHDHPIDCIEFVVPLTEGMFSLTVINGEKIRTPIPALKVFRVEGEVMHSDYNDGYDPLVYVIFRAKLMGGA